MNVRRLWAAGLALTMVLGLAACGGEADVFPAPSAEEAETPQATVTPSAAPAETPAATVKPTAAPTLEADPDQPTIPPVKLREYTLTEIDLPEGWSPTADSNNVAAGWAVIERLESEQVVEAAVYRASDGAILDLAGCWVYGGEGPMSRGDATRCLVFLPEPPEVTDWGAIDPKSGFFDVETGKLQSEEEEALWKESHLTWPQPKEDEATGLWGYVDEAGNWVLPPQYYDHPAPFMDGMAVVDLTEYDLAKGSLCNAIDVTGKELLPRRYKDLFYLGDGMFNYWGDNFQDNQWWTDCGLVSKDGVEYPSQTFQNYFNGGLTANYGLISIYFDNDSSYHHAYFDYAGNQVSEPFDWAGPIGDDGAGFVCRDGKLCRIQFQK